MRHLARTCRGVALCGAPMSESTFLDLTCGRCAQFADQDYCRKCGQTNFHWTGCNREAA